MITIGERFMYGKQEFEVTSFDELDKNTLPRMVQICEETGKYPAQIFAKKVLKSGKLSKNGGMFYKFKKSGNFSKAF